jgi:hypothetical protein
VGWRRGHTHLGIVVASAAGPETSTWEVGGGEGGGMGTRACRDNNGRATGRSSGQRREGRLGGRRRWRASILSQEVFRGPGEAHGMRVGGAAAMQGGTEACWDRGRRAGGVPMNAQA